MGYGKPLLDQPNLNPHYLTVDDMVNIKKNKPNLDARIAYRDSQTK